MAKLGLAFAKEHEVELRGFLYKAIGHSYGSEDKPTVHEDGRHTIAYQEGDWEYRENWYGGQPYAGIIVIRYQGKACWNMTYWGQTLSDTPKMPVFDCLKEALAARDPNYPYRGPEYFSASNGLRYMNSWSDVWESDSFGFQGKEVIVDQSGAPLYEMNYSGGFVDLF